MVLSAVGFAETEPVIVTWIYWSRIYEATLWDKTHDYHEGHISVVFTLRPDKRYTILLRTKENSPRRKLNQINRLYKPETRNFDKKNYYYGMYVLGKCKTPDLPQPNVKK